VRSTQLLVPGDDPAAGRATLLALVDVGISHLVLAPRPPHPPNVVRWLVDELILPTKNRVLER
jgi:hypothetical protein